MNASLDEGLGRRLTRRICLSGCSEGSSVEGEATKQQVQQPTEPDGDADGDGASQVEDAREASGERETLPSCYDQLPVALTLSLCLPAWTAPGKEAEQLALHPRILSARLKNPRSHCSSSSGANLHCAMLHR